MWAPAASPAACISPMFPNISPYLPIYHQLLDQLLMYLPYLRVYSHISPYLPRAAGPAACISSISPCISPYLPVSPTSCWTSCFDISHISVYLPISRHIPRQLLDKLLLYLPYLRIAPHISPYLPPAAGPAAAVAPRVHALLLRVTS